MQRKAFTVVEMVVVVSVMAVVLALALPSMNRARENARRVSCMANLRGLNNFAVSRLYNSDGNPKQPAGRLPDLRNGVANTWDGGQPEMPPYYMRKAARNWMMQEYGFSREQFYCPSNQEGWNKDELWDWDANTTVFGYFYFGDMNAAIERSLGAFVWLDGTDLLPPAPYFHTSRDTIRPSHQLIWADLNRTWAGTGGGFGTDNPRRGANHYDAGARPAGTHHAFLDGSVRWVPFAEMQQRARVTTASSVVLWW